MQETRKRFPIEYPARRAHKTCDGDTLLEGKSITCRFKHVMVPVCWVGDSDVTHLLLSQGWASLANGGPEWNPCRIEFATSRWPCASRSRARVRVFARKSAAVDPAATRGLRTRRDAALQPVCPGRSAGQRLHVSLPSLP